jgi:hypothetical protein
MTGVLEELLDTGNVAAPVNYEERLAELVPDNAKGLDQAKQKAAVSRRIGDALAWIDGAKAQKAIDADVADFMVAQLGDHPAGIKAIEFMAGLGSKIVPAGGGRGAGAISEADLKARANDPRNDPRSMNFDRDYAAETDRLYKETYGP